MRALSPSGIFRNNFNQSNTKMVQSKRNLKQPEGEFISTQ